MPRHPPSKKVALPTGANAPVAGQIKVCGLYHGQVQSEDRLKTSFCRSLRALILKTQIMQERTVSHECDKNSIFGNNGSETIPTPLKPQRLSKPPI